MGWSEASVWLIKDDTNESDDCGGGDDDVKPQIESMLESVLCQ